MTIMKGDIVTVRTSATGKKVKAKVLFVNFKHGWYTAEIKTDMGNYRESFYIRDLDEKDKELDRQQRMRWWEEDNPDEWLGEWSEDRIHGK